MVQYQNQLLEYQSLLKEHQTREALDSNKIVLDTVEWERKYILLLKVVYIFLRQIAKSNTTFPYLVLHKVLFCCGHIHL